MGRKVATPDARVAEIARKQYGVVSVEQLRRVGLDDKGIRTRMNAARLHRVHRGVYAVGHTSLAREGHWLAAVLAVGRGPHEDGEAILDHWGAAVSHGSAASLWELLPVRPGACDVAVRGDGGRARRAGIRVHRSRSLSDVDVTLRYGIPVTTPGRTIADLRKASSAGSAGAISAWELRRAIRQANVIGLPIDDEDAADRTRSDLEGAFLSICRRHRLPRPEVNVRIGPFLVDFLWRGQRLVVETDGYRYHRGRVAFQGDRGRELQLMGLGYNVLRLSERQIDEEPKRVGEVLGAALRKRRGGPPGGEAVSPER
jgi:very-short-patch-repair endonuclease